MLPERPAVPVGIERKKRNEAASERDTIDGEHLTVRKAEDAAQDPC